MATQLISPTNGHPLRPAGPQLLTDGERLWPLVDGIAYLREGPLARHAVTLLENDQIDAARRALLTDRDRFAPGEPADPAALDLLFAPNTSLRTAMQILGYGPVGDYFAHRWTSPTYGTGTELLERTVRTGEPVVEVACGIGHFLRLLEQHDFTTIGIDIVYSKLWLARRFLGVRGLLVCGDIERSALLRFVTLERVAPTVFCHDAFYFFERKDAALRHLRQLAGKAGRVAIGHVHTRQDAHEAGFAATPADYQQLTSAPVLSEGRADDPAAVYWIEGGENEQLYSLRNATPGLRWNPLLSREGVRWPSAGWRREYEADCARTGTKSLAAIWEMADRTSLVSDAPRAVLTTTDYQHYHAQRLLVNLPAQW